MNPPQTPEPTTTELLTEIRSLGENISGLRRLIEDLDVRSARHDRRLAAIESLPSMPVRQVGQAGYLYGTDADSVSLPERVRVGRVG